MEARTEWPMYNRGLGRQVVIPQRDFGVPIFDQIHYNLLGIFNSLNKFRP